MVGQLSAEQLGLNIQSTVMAGKLRHYDSTEAGVGCAIPLCLPNDTEWDSATHKCKHLKDVTRTSLVLIPPAVDILRSISGQYV